MCFTRTVGTLWLGLLAECSDLGLSQCFSKCGSWTTSGLQATTSSPQGDAQQITFKIFKFKYLKFS